MNDLREPHPVGIRVWIKRHHHGWVDGREEGTITLANQRPTGSWFYEVTKDDGWVYHVDHTRDLVPA